MPNSGSFKEDSAEPSGSVWTPLAITYEMYAPSYFLICVCRKEKHRRSSLEKSHVLELSTVSDLFSRSQLS